jgi:hypothetical protein
MTATLANVCNYRIGFRSGATIVHKHARSGISERQSGSSPNTA